MTGRAAARARLWACAPLGAALVLLLTAACGAPADEPASPEVARTSSAADAGRPDALALVGVDGVGLSTVGWGANDGLLSVLVRNDTSRLLRRAVASIRALDADGTVVANTAGLTDQSACCTAVTVAPGETYGFYLSLGETPSSEVADVDVTFPDVVFSALDAPRGPAVRATPVALEDGATSAVVVADLRAVGGVVNDAVVQARLLGPDGRFSTIVSGRWSCLRPDQTARAQIELFHPVPAGTTIEGVSVFPLAPATDEQPTAC